MQKHFHVRRKTMLGIYSTCEVQSLTKRLGHFAQIMGHIFVLEEGRNLVKAVFMIGISSSLRASIHLGESKEVTREQHAKGAANARGFAARSRVHSRWLYCRLAANSIQSTQKRDCVPKPFGQDCKCLLARFKKKKKAYPTILSP